MAVNLSNQRRMNIQLGLVNARNSFVFCFWEVYLSTFLNKEIFLAHFPLHFINKFRSREYIIQFAFSWVHNSLPLVARDYLIIPTNLLIDILNVYFWKRTIGVKLSTDFHWKLGKEEKKQAGLDITIVMEANDVMNKTFYREIYVKYFLQFT